MCRLASVPLSHVRSTRAAGGMSLKISYSALAVADALLSSTSRANSLRLLRSTCVFMQRLDGAAPTTVSDSKWPNPFLDPTASGRSAMGTRIGMRGPFAFLPFCAGRPFSARPAPNRTDPRSTARSSAVSAGRAGTTRSRWTRTTGRASARGSRWTCPGRSSPRSDGCSDAVRNAASRSGSSPRTTGANTVDP